MKEELFGGGLVPVDLHRVLGADGDAAAAAHASEVEVPVAGGEYVQNAKIRSPVPTVQPSA